MFRISMLASAVAVVMSSLLASSQPLSMTAQQQCERSGAGWPNYYECEVIGDSCNYDENAPGDPCPGQLDDTDDYCGVVVHDEECEPSSWTDDCVGSAQANCPTAVLIKCTLYASGAEWVKVPSGVPLDGDCGHHLACF